MNTGILTFTHALNYGAVLQGIALNEVASQITGHQAELIDYRCRKVEDRETPKRANPRELIHPRLFSRHLYGYRALCKRAVAFERFERDFCTYGERVDGQEGIAASYDTVVVGSDQVWSPVITGSDVTFFLGNPSCSKVKKVAYAASFGDFSASWQNPDRIAGWLEQFKAIGVREVSGRVALNRLGIDDAQVVLDPTLLLGGEDWSKVARPSRQTKGYVFAYSVSERRKTLSHARRIARRMNADLVFLECYPKAPALGTISVNSIAPDEFLGYIKNAAYVVTSSFHGMCFSILFEKPFRFVTSKGADYRRTRTYALAKSLGLEKVRLSDDLEVIPKIEYESVNHKLDELRDKSLDFLSGALQD